MILCLIKRNSKELRSFVKAFLHIRSESQYDGGAFSRASDRQGQDGGRPGDDRDMQYPALHRVLTRGESRLSARRSLKGEHCLFGERVVEKGQNRGDTAGLNASGCIHTNKFKKTRIAF